MRHLCIPPLTIYAVARYLQHCNHNNHISLSFFFGKLRITFSNNVIKALNFNAKMMRKDRTNLRTFVSSMCTSLIGTIIHKVRMHRKVMSIEPTFACKCHLASWTFIRTLIAENNIALRARYANAFGKCSIIYNNILMSNLLQSICNLCSIARDCKLLCIHLVYHSQRSWSRYIWCIPHSCSVICACPQRQNCNQQSTKQ